VAVIGHLNSGVSMAAAPVYAAKMIPQLAISTKPEYTQMGLPTTFRLVASDALQSKAMGAFAAQLPGGPTLRRGGRRHALRQGPGPVGQGPAEARQREVVLEMSLDAKTTDFAKLIEGLKAQKADVLVTTLADFQVLALADQLAAAGVKLPSSAATPSRPRPWPRPTRRPARSTRPRPSSAWTSSWAARPS
jgi:branched-chain amino acid transport system substrate-binding protein